MFVRLVQKTNDRVSLRIVENVKIDGVPKQKTVCGLGTFHKNETKEIEHFKEIAEGIIVKIAEKRSVQLALPGFEEMVFAPKKRKRPPKTQEASCDPRDLKEEKRVHTGVKNIFEQEYKQMGLFDSIDTGYKTKERNDLLKTIVLERIDAPNSKLKSVVNLKRHKDLDISIDKVYRMMDRLYAHEDRVKTKIAQQTISLFENKIDVCFFDVTTLYFESFVPDELRVSGYSKDNKIKETQVVLALMTTRDGLPLGYELYPGNTWEGGTLINAVDSLKKKYDVSNTFVVADRGMFAANNLRELEKKGVNFIIAAKLKSMSRQFKEMILQETNRKAKYSVKEYEYDSCRLIVSYCQKRAKKQKRERDAILAKLEKKTRGGKIWVSDLIKNSGEKKYLKLDKKSSQTGSINMEKVANEEQWDGIYGVITNYRNSDMSCHDIISRHRGLWQIEDAFRVNKHDMKMRPIYHWTPNRIRAHILICFMAYALITRVKYKLRQAGVNLSVARIKEELLSIQSSVVWDGKSNRRFLLPSSLNDTQAKIFTALGVKYNNQVQLLS